MIAPARCCSRTRVRMTCLIYDFPIQTYAIYIWVLLIDIINKFIIRGRRMSIKTGSRAQEEQRQGYIWVSYMLVLLVVLMTVFCFNLWLSVTSLTQEVA